MSKLRISEDLSLPLDAATETFCILAMRGKGKTHTASVMAEEMLKAGVPVVIYDPTGAWFGLKSSADGKHKAYPVAIFGGDHADVPLEPDAGETIARAIVQNRYAAILDVSRLRKGKRISFMADFVEALYHENREALHFIADEVHTIAPTNIRDKGGDAARCLGAMEDLILQGRVRGLGTTAISQRPALVNTTVRTQCSSLFAMGMSGLHDIKAVMEWVEVQADEQQAAQMLASLPTLPRGEGWFWSPSAFDVFKRIKVRARETFDSSRTPKVGEARPVPKVLAAPDLDKLGAAIKATVEQARANDPTALKRRVAELERQLSQRPKEQVEKVVEKVVEVPVLKNSLLDKTNKLADRIGTLADRFGAELTELRTLIAKAVRQPATTTMPRPAAARPTARPVPRPVARPTAVVVEGGEELTGPERKILDALIWLESIGVSEPEQPAAAFLAGYTVGGGAWNNPKGRLRGRGLIEYLPGDRLRLTDQGRALATVPDEPLTADELHRKVMDVLPGPEQRILKPLLECYPDAMSNEDLAAAACYSDGGGAYNNPRGRLRTLGLIEYRDGGVAARSILFP